MLERDTTFIIGAGASSDLGLPLGDTLRGRIIEVLADDPQKSLGFTDPSISEIVRDRVQREAETPVWPIQLGHYRVAAATIRFGLPFARSIDTFIDGLTHLEHIKFLSKLAIATVILRGEADAPLIEKHIQAANAE